MYAEYLEEIAINGVNIPEFAIKKEYGRVHSYRFYLLSILFVSRLL
jgi:hypothetical protein